MAGRDKALRATGLAALCERLKEYFKKTDAAGASLIELSESTEAGFAEAEAGIAAAAKTAEASGVTFEDGETFQQKFDNGDLTGPPGESGAGSAGPKGDPGDTWVPSVDESGLLTWEKNSGTEPVPRNIKGADGAAGAPGAQGDAGPAGPNVVSEETTTALNGLLKGDGGKVAAAVAGTDYAKAPAAVTVKLLSSGWVAPTRAPDPQQSASPFTSKMQTVDCAGVLANETLQEVSICPAAAQFKTYMDAGIYVSAVTDGKLTFTCDTAPASELTVYVKIQNL